MTTTAEVSSDKCSISHCTLANVAAVPFIPRNAPSVKSAMWECQGQFVSLYDALDKLLEHGFLYHAQLEGRFHSLVLFMKACGEEPEFYWITYNGAILPIANLIEASRIMLFVFSISWDLRLDCALRVARITMVFPDHPLWSSIARLEKFYNPDAAQCRKIFKLGNLKSPTRARGKFMRLQLKQLNGGSNLVSRALSNYNIQSQLDVEPVPHLEPPQVPMPYKRPSLSQYLDSLAPAPLPTDVTPTPAPLVNDVYTFASSVYTDEAILPHLDPFLENTSFIEQLSEIFVRPPVESQTELQKFCFTAVQVLIDMAKKKQG